VGEAIVGSLLQKRLHGLSDNVSNGDAGESRWLSLRKAQDIPQGSGNVPAALYRWVTATCHSGVRRLRHAHVDNARSGINHGSPIPDYRGKSGRFPKYDWPQILQEVENLYSEEPWPESYTAAARHIIAWLQELRVEPPDENYLRLRISQHMHERQHPAAVAMCRDAAPETATSHQPQRARVLRRAVELSIVLVLVLVVGIAGYEVGINDAHHPHVIEEVVGYFVVHAEDPDRIVEIGGGDRAQIESWFSRRIGTEVRVPDLTRFGLTFRGGRLMVVGALPAPMLLYETADRRLVGLCMVNTKSDHPNSVHSHQAPDLNAYSWAHRGVLFVLVGWIDVDFLLSIAHDINSQIASAGGLKGTVVR
jgi:anti-sigma factor RsiW